MVEALNVFADYDFMKLFRKADPHFIDGATGPEHKFPALKIIMVIKELEDFLIASKTLKPEGDWKNLLNLFNMCAGQELAKPDQFETVIKNIWELHTSKIIELMIQYTLKNPVWVWVAHDHDVQLGENWLEDKKNEAEMFIHHINEAQKNSQINALVKQIFETSELIRLYNYTPQHSHMYRKKGLEYFEYAEGVNYLKTFLEDYLAKDIKELCDILLIRGQWTINTMSKEMSESLHQLLEMPNLIDSLDQIMSEEGKDGSRLRAAIVRVDRDKTQIRYINSIIGNNNEEALEIINKAAQNFIVIGKHLKSLIEDVQKKHPELIVNWRELNMFTKDPMAQRMVTDYKRINYFIQLMKLCTD
jgi:hypothetical protein